jgi:hypothetical protein
MSALHMMRMNGYSGVATVTFSMLIDELALAVAALGVAKMIGYTSWEQQK